ncbi:outer membrane protein assembly factor BamA [Spirochaetia bacterium]|nr:outer membrane protein assembly factor BamA [Spirochaetia bacterium]
MRKGLAVVLITFLAGFGFAQAVPPSEESSRQAAPPAEEQQASSAGDWYQGKPIKNIIFDGLRHISASELGGVIDAYIGLRFNDDVFGELYGKLYTLEYFDVITPSVVPADAGGAEVIIRFQVTERPIVSRINFSGNSLRRSELLEVITLKEKDVVNQLKLRIDELALTNKYLEKGYPDIRIHTETQTNKDSSITVTFFIEEGRRVTIEAFRFEGNSTFSERALRGQLSLKAKGLFNDGAFQEAKLIADRAALTQYYHNRGYIDAEVIDVVQDTTVDEKGNNNMTITFRLYEGRIYNFGGVSFEGNKIFKTDQLAAMVLSKEGKTVNARLVEADLQRVADLYYENGYIFNTINRTEERNMETGTIAYVISIVERGRAHIENIIIRGNEKTRESVIRREIPLEPGDIFSKSKVMDGLRNLYNLQFFSNVVPDTPPGSADSLMDLIINVEEQPTQNIQFGLTFSGSANPDDIPVSLLFQWNDRNFLGFGNTFGAELNVSDDTQSASLQYTQRWIFGLPLSGSFDFTFRHTQRTAYMDSQFPVFNGNEEKTAYPDGFDSYDDYTNAGYYPSDEYLMTYDQWSFSLGLSTGYRWLTPAGNLGVGGGLRAAWVNNTYDASLFRPFNPVLRQDNNSFVPAFSFWASVSLDQRDVYYDPSRGYYFTERFGIYGFFNMEREHYTKTETKAEYFITLLNLPLSEKFSLKAVLGLHTGLSFILPQAGRAAPVVEDANKLVVDGMFVGRGWSTQRLNYGLALWENWAEIRFPIVPGIIALDVLFDAAAVKGTPRDFFNNFSMNDMLFSTGLGIRLSIPQFPFRFLFTKGFQVIDGQVKWKDGTIGGKYGPDFTLSISLSTY